MNRTLYHDSRQVVKGRAISFTVMLFVATSIYGPSGIGNNRREKPAFDVRCQVYQPIVTSPLALRIVN